ncbi:unnamed protein product [Cylicocyclus nassatus]|uniref:Uncharacterized protein n=1 Tax=Cylicocyclus nassatus TaxID=53992 RepID=A0AA36MC55_CYLNA|nr:unnamed protein product [Cylicocyclus nassatus]
MQHSLSYLCVDTCPHFVGSRNFACVVLSTVYAEMRLYTLLIATLLAAACMAVPFRIARVYPAMLRRIPQYDDSDEVLLMIPRFRQRRSQPIIDYTDEFSADPFEVPENAAEQRPKNLAVLDLY